MDALGVSAGRAVPFNVTVSFPSKPFIAVGIGYTVVWERALVSGIIQASAGAGWRPLVLYQEEAAVNGRLMPMTFTFYAPDRLDAVTGMQIHETIPLVINVTTKETRNFPDQNGQYPVHYYNYSYRQGLPTTWQAALIDDGVLNLSRSEGGWTIYELPPPPDQQW